MLNQERHPGHQSLPVPGPELATNPIQQPSQAELSDSELAQHLHDPERRDPAMEKLVYRYQAMVRALARQYQLPAQHYEDLTQAGYVGLMKAINNFDPAIRPDLKPYARACVDGEIKRYFRDKRWLIRVSRSDQELLLAAKKAHAALAAEIGGTPTDDDVAEHLNVTTEELRHAYQAHQAFAPGSIDAPVSGDDDRTAGDLIGAEDPQLAQSDAMNAVQQHWNDLPATQRKVLLMRFYGNMTQAQVADRLHCSQMHVSRLQSRALAFLRQQIQTE
jgi:RNA polymerase sigma-B factor